MKYVVKSIVMLLILTFVFCAGGCKEKEVDERTLSVFELEFSDEAAEELEVAYKNKVWEAEREKASKDITDEEVTAFVDQVWNGVNPVENGVPSKRFGTYRYYGTFGNCVVWFREYNLTAEEDFELAGSRFHNPCVCVFQVCIEGQLITLQEAYEQGFISAEDIAIVAARHAEYNAE